MPAVMKSMKPYSPSKKDDDDDEVTLEDVEKEAKTMIDKILGDISKTSATKQIVIGATSGWITGFLAMRIGKAAALAVGGGVILLQVANEKGYININWDKVNRKLDKVADKVEKKVTGEGPSWIDKAERFIDRKLDKAEDKLKKQKGKVKKLFHKAAGEEEGFQLQEIHIFLVSFLAGIALGMGSA